MKHFDGMSFPGTTCFNEIHSTFHCHIGSCLDFIESLCSLSMQLNWRNFFTEKAIKKKKKRQKTNWSFHFANFHASWFLLCFNSCFSAEEVLMHINMLIRSVFSLDVSNVLTLSTSSCETASRNYQRFVKSPVTMFFSITSIDCWWLCRSTNIVLWSCLFTILVPHW